MCGLGRSVRVHTQVDFFYGAIQSIRPRLDASLEAIRQVLLDLQIKTRFIFADVPTV